MSRRLTRAEYNNCVRDLFGLDFRPADQFPSDGAGGEGFDTTGSSLFTSAVSFEQYLLAAEQVANSFLPDTMSTPLPDYVQEARAKWMRESDANFTLLPARDRAEQMLENLARRAWRQPLTGDELAPVLALFDRAQARGDSFHASLRLAVQGILISPRFLFLLEPEPEPRGRYRLDAHSFANRLAFFVGRLCRMNRYNYSPMRIPSSNQKFGKRNSAVC